MKLKNKIYFRIREYNKYEINSGDLDPIECNSLDITKAVIPSYVKSGQLFERKEIVYDGETFISKETTHPTIYFFAEKENILDAEKIREFIDIPEEYDNFNHGARSLLSYMRTNKIECVVKLGNFSYGDLYEGKNNRLVLNSKKEIIYPIN